jgi:hypothetical protein
VNKEEGAVFRMVQYEVAQRPYIIPIAPFTLNSESRKKQLKKGTPSSHAYFLDTRTLSN